MNIFQKILFIYFIYITFCNSINLYNAKEIANLDYKYQEYAGSSVTIELEYKNLLYQSTRTCSGVIIRNDYSQLEVVTSIRCIDEVKKGGLYLSLVGVRINYLTDEFTKLKSYYVSIKDLTLIKKTESGDILSNNNILIIRINDNLSSKKNTTVIPSALSDITESEFVPSSIILNLYHRFNNFYGKVSYLWCGQKKYSKTNKFFPICKVFETQDSLPISAEYNAKKDEIHYLSYNAALSYVSDEDLGGPLFLCITTEKFREFKCYLTGMYSSSKEITSIIANNVKKHYNKILFSILTNN